MAFKSFWLAQIYRLMRFAHLVVGVWLLVHLWDAFYNLKSDPGSEQIANGLEQALNLGYGILGLSYFFVGLLLTLIAPRRVGMGLPLIPLLVAILYFGGLSWWDGSALLIQQTIELVLFLTAFQAVSIFVIWQNKKR